MGAKNKKAFMDERQKIEKQYFISALMVLLPLFTGGFFEYSSCVLTMLLIGWLWKVQKGSVLRWRIGWASAGVFALCCGYVLSILWAVDQGLAEIGCAKFIPLLLMAVIFQKHSNQARMQALEVIPWCGGVMTILSAAVSLIPGCSDLVTVNHRLAAEPYF